MATQRVKLLSTQNTAGLASFPGFENYYPLNIPIGTDVFVVLIQAEWHSGARCTLGGRPMTSRVEMSDGNVRYVSLHDIVRPMAGLRDFVAYWGGGGSAFHITTAALRYVDVRRPLVAAAATTAGYGANRSMDIAAALGGAVVDILSVYVDVTSNTPNAGQVALYSGDGVYGVKSSNVSFKPAVAGVENVGWPNTAGFIAQVAASYRPRTTPISAGAMLPSGRLVPKLDLGVSGWVGA